MSVEGGGGSAGGTSRPPVTTALSPVSAVLQGLFGQNVGISEGGYQLLGPASRGRELRGRISPLATQAFGPGSFESIADLLTPQNMGAIFTPELIAQIGAGAGEGLDLYGEAIMPGLREAAQTGLRTDITPIVEREQRRYWEETVPGLREQFAGLTGGFSTDFMGQLAREAAAMGTELGGIQAQLDEAAAARRMEAFPMAGLLAGERIALPAQAAAEALNLGEQFILDATRGGRAATVLQMLAGLQPTSAIPRGNISQQQSKSGQGGMSLG